MRVEEESRVDNAERDSILIATDSEWAIEGKSYLFKFVIDYASYEWRILLVITDVSREQGSATTTATVLNNIVS